MVKNYKKSIFLAVCVSFWGEKQFSFIFVQFYCFEQKGLFITNPNFPLDFPLFKLVEKNKPSKYFWPFFWDSHFLTKKRHFQWISPKRQKKTQTHSLNLWGSFWGEKELFFYLSYFTAWTKRVFKTNPNFSQDLLLFNLVEK